MKWSKLAGIGVMLIVASAASAWFFLSAQSNEILLSDVRAVPAMNAPGTVRILVKFSNRGRADELISVSSVEGDKGVLENAEATPLPVPANSNPQLAKDGAHGIIRGVNGELADGRLIPIALTFKNAGTVNAKARMREAIAMSHDTMFEVPEGETAPTLSISASRNDKGWLIDIDAPGFTFSKDKVDGPHIANTGHGHLYIDGLKLGRVYGTQVKIGNLPIGTHTVRVSLNTNDHRMYMTNGKSVSAETEITSK
ncbi:MAG: hypothetical protein ACR2OJ_12425 [Hyphomicrobiales bacterium]